MKRLSVVIPVKDEQDNIAPLVQWLRDSLEDLDDWEVIFVDDGSTDHTFPRLRELATIDHRLKIVRLRRNFGQSAALQAGFDFASGDVIATMDGDLQNDPADLPRMLEKLEEGYDAVFGQRLHRQDRLLLRKVPSWCANWLIRRVLGVRFKDFGCTLRVINRDIVDGMSLQGEMHRFINALAFQQGARIAQMPVRHHARTAGKSKYNITRTVRVLLDLLTVKFLGSYQTRPMHLFGGLGLLLMLGGMLSLGVTVLMKWTNGQWMTGNPFLYLSIMLEVMGVQFLSLGLMGEVQARLMFEKQGQRPYAVRQCQNIEPESAIETANYREVA